MCYEKVLFYILTYFYAKRYVLLRLLCIIHLSYFSIRE